VAAGTPRDFRGRGAVVTGASRGIGEAVARALSREGFRLLLVGRDTERLSALASELARSGGSTKFVAADLTTESGIASVLQAVSRELGVPYLLVNNAGLGYADRFERQAPEEIDAMIRLNLGAAVALSRALLPGMIASGEGRLIHIGSGSADITPARMAVYGATKAALRMFSLTLDAELRSRGLRSSVVEPWFVRTELGRRPGDLEPPVQRFARRHPRLVLPPEAVARAVVRLLYRPRARVAVPLTWAVTRRMMIPFLPLIRRSFTLSPPSPRASPPSVPKG
jgi:uncharacterized protein